MIETRDEAQVLAQEFLPLRGKLLEVAAALDRLDRAPGTAESAKLVQVRQALEALLTRGPGGRAEALQLIFSLSYDPQWRDELGPVGQGR